MVEQDSTALVVRLRAGGDPLRVPLDAFERLEVARGQRRHFWTGAAVGFVPGAAFGAMAGWFVGCDDQGVDCTAYPAAIATGAILGAGTALAGGLVGLLFKSVPCRGRACRSACPSASRPWPGMSTWRRPRFG